MKLIIDIREELYYACKSRDKDNAATSEQSMIAHGTPYDEERPHGEWVHTTVGNTEFINCKNCGCGCPLYSYVKKGEKEEKVQHYETDFCPNCGASMVKKEGYKE